MNNKVAVFGDIHGNLPALKVILEDIKSKNINNIICLGDTICLGPYINECLDLLKEYNVKMVLGNHELYILNGTDIDDEMSEDEIRHHQYVDSIISEENLDYLRQCPIVIKDKIGNLNVCYQHFLFNEDKEDVYPFENLMVIKNTLIKDIMNYVDDGITFVGHEHRDFLLDAGDKKLVGVGSSGCRYDDNTYYTVLDVIDNEAKINRVVLKYNRLEFEEKINEEDYPDRENVKRFYFGM